MPKVSIILPVYNVEKYLRQCINSLVNQTLQDIEIICINDGSTDSSLGILNEYQAKDSRIVVISQENKGTGTARNVGIDNSRGECLAFVDPDDWVELNTFEELYKKYKENDVDIVQHDHAYFNEAKNKFGKVVFSEHALHKLKINITDGSIYNWKDIVNKDFSLLVLATWGRLYSARFIKENNIRFAPNKCSEDNIFTIKAIMLAQKILYIQKPFYNYRVRTDSCSHKTSDENFCIFDNIKMLKEFLVEKGWMGNYKKEYLKYVIYILRWHYMLIPPKSIKKYLKNSKTALTPKGYKKFLNEIHLDSGFEKVFSVKNIGIYKQLCILGLKFKIKSQKLVEREKIKQIIRNQEHQIGLLNKILKLETQKSNQNLKLTVEN